MSDPTVSDPSADRPAAPGTVVTTQRDEGADAVIEADAERGVPPYA